MHNPDPYMMHQMGPPQFPSDPGFGNPTFQTAMMGSQPDYSSYAYGAPVPPDMEGYPPPGAQGPPGQGAFYPPAAQVVPTLTRLQLGPAEMSHYMNLRAMQEGDQSGNLGGAEAAAFLATSGLPRPILHEIWRLSDANNAGYLALEDFFVACRLVAHAQNGLPVWEDAILQEPPSLPMFNLPPQEAIPPDSLPPMGSDPSQGPPLGAQYDPTRAAYESSPSGLSMQSPGYFTSTGAWEEDGTIDLTAPPSWLLSDTDKEKYIRGFKHADGNGDGFVEGHEGVALLRKSGLPEHELSHVWTLADADCDGRLTVNEFLTAMHLVTKRRQGMPLPGSLPPELQLVLQTPVTIEAPVFTETQPTFGGGGGFPAPPPPADEPWKSLAEAPSSGRDEFGGTFASIVPPPGETKSDKKTRKLKEKKKLTDALRDDEGDDERPFGDRVLEQTEKDKSREQFDLDWDIAPDRGETKPRRKKDTIVPGDDDGATSILDTVVESDRQLNRRLAREIDNYADEINRLSAVSDALKAELIREKAELKRQLDRKLDFEGRVAELKLELEGIKDEKRKVDVERSSVARDVDHYQEEILFLQQQVDDVEKDIKILRETTLQLNRQHDETEKHSRQLDMARKNVLHTLKTERQTLHEEEKRISELRNVLERLRREKEQNQSKQIVAQEKLRQSAQDRSMLLAGLESERSRLSKLRKQRLDLAEERSTMDGEFAELQQKLMQSQGGHALTFGDRPRPASPSEGTWSSSMSRTARYPGRDAKGVPVSAPIPANFYHSAPTAPSYPDGKPSHWTVFGTTRGGGGGSVRVSSSGGTAAVERDRRGIDRILARDTAVAAGAKSAFESEKEIDYIGSRRGGEMKHSPASTSKKASSSKKKKRTPNTGSDSDKVPSDSGPPSWPSFAEGSEMTPSFGQGK